MKIYFWSFVYQDYSGIQSVILKERDMQVILFLFNYSIRGLLILKMIMSRALRD